MNEQTERVSRQFHLRLPSDLYDWLKGAAKTNRRSMNSEFILALEAWRLSKEVSVSRVKNLLLEE